MSDAGGPEDPEVAKLREQLAAAERLAELRAELEAARAELAALDAEISLRAEQAQEQQRQERIRKERQEALHAWQTRRAERTQEREDQAERSLPSPTNQPSPQRPAPGTKTKRVAARWLLGVIAMGIIGGVIALVVLNNREPEISITCPADNEQDGDILSTKVGRNLNWGLAKIEKVDIDFGDGKSVVEQFYDGYSSDSSFDDSKMDEAFRHTYRNPGTYEIVATVTDSNGRSAEDSCRFEWSPPESAKAVPATKTLKPTIDLDCPKSRTTSAESINVTIGAAWSWSKSAGFKKLVIDFGDGTTKRSSSSSKSSLARTLEHTYSNAGSYTVRATLTDGHNTDVFDSCYWKWTRTTKSTSSVSATTRQILTASYRYGESSQGVKNLQQTIREVTGTVFSADGIYGPTTRMHHIRALNKLGLSTSRVPSKPAAPANAKYKLYQDQGRNLRWGPCQGSVRIGMNPNNTLTVPQLKLWDDFFRIEAAELSRLTGLNVIYIGHTTYVPTTSWVDRKTMPQDVLFFFGPPGSSSVLIAGEGEYYGSTSRGFDDRVKTDPSFFPINSFEFHVNSDRFGTRVTDSRYLKYFLGQAMGLDDPDDENSSEIMNWGSDGSGSYGDPQWGSGDKVGLELVGASNGCF